MIEQKELDHDENYRYIEEIQYDKDTQKKMENSETTGYRNGYRVISLCSFIK